MRIIAVNRFYRPDHSATAQLLGDLAERFAASGHHVTVVTSRLRYEGGERLASRETISGVHVRRIWTTHFGRSNLVGRAFDYLTFYASAFFCMLIVGRRGAVLIAKTDPPLISVPAGWACRLRGMKLVNWCQDLFPEIAGALGMKWAKGWIGYVCRWARNRSLRMASINVVLNEAMADRVKAQKVSHDRIRVIANWPEASIRPIARDQNPLRSEWGYGPEAFVIGYSGNLGRAHMPEKIADLVIATSTIGNVAWLFIGGGVGLKKLKEDVGEYAHVAFKPYQPLSRLSESLSVPDAHLVSLDPACEGYIMPSKLYGALAVQRPVLALAQTGQGVSAEVERLHGGVTIDCNVNLGRQIATIEQVLESLDVAGGAQPVAYLPANAQAQCAYHAWSECVTVGTLTQETPVSWSAIA